ncbi:MULTISPECIES: acyltransferase family protein [unclassified Pseudomonas]|uniref:acyltransferase family protein n=1 Tax=unclassified Pseudomonas TaxID=196821 RepID=UPI0039B76623
MKGKQLPYRPEIDGLRALAVILVLLFHFELGITGGYIGVDVFFVISGYLITELIRNSINAGRFSFVDFYARRLLRLHPALLTTVFISLVAGFVLMDPASFSGLAESAKYTIFSASNFYFWINQGYFDAASLTKPLLHTWSLAAEWQFYLVWPLIVWFSLKWFDRYISWLLVLLTLVSLLASQLMLGYDSSAAYFLIPFRVFELSIGALIVFAPKNFFDSKLNTFITWSGISSIIIAAVSFKPGTPFPGVAALLPCLGAAACIYAGDSSTGRILRSRPVVFIGLISYSIYLVHWPLLVFYKYYVFRETSPMEKIVLLLTSIALGAALYYSVEKLFMAKRNFIKPLGLIAIATASAISIYGCSIIISSEGMKNRVSKEYLNFTNDPKNFHINNYGGNGYKLDAPLGDTQGKALAILAGDSFALQYAHGLDSSLNTSGGFIQSQFQHGCLFSKNYVRLVNNHPVKGCRESYDALLKKLSSNQLPLIIAQHWAGYRGQIADENLELIDSTSDDRYRDIIFDLLAKIRADIGNRKLIIIGSQPISKGGSPAECILRPSYVTQPCESLLSYNRKKSMSEFTNGILNDFAHTHSNTYFLDPSNAFCPKDQCRNISAGKILYSDYVHLSKDGSDVAADWLTPELNAIISM